MAIFSQFIPERPLAYQKFHTFIETLETLLVEQEQALCTFFVGRDNQQRIVVRANLNEINWDNHSADIGHRVCESVKGQGITSEAVAQLINLAKERGLTTLTATVANNNPASQRILVKNNFHYLRTDFAAFEFNGELLDFRYFERSVS